MALRRLLYTSDPHEPSGTIGIYETEEQKQAIIEAYVAHWLQSFPDLGDDYFRRGLGDEEIEIGVYYP